MINFAFISLSRNSQVKYSYTSQKNEAIHRRYMKITIDFDSRLTQLSINLIRF